MKKKFDKIIILINHNQLFFKVKYIDYIQVKTDRQKLNVYYHYKA